MRRRGILTLPLAAVALADRANGDPRKQKLYSLFIAPCCWRANLLVHDSPKAFELRAEIDRFIAEGLTDDEIKRRYVDRYSVRILSHPEGAAGRWLDWSPLALIGASLILVGVWLRELLRPGPSPGSPSPPLPPVPDDIEAEGDNLP